MATFAIGDLQGCYAEFAQLLQLIAFNPTRDRLWLVGDLVNRGPDSLAVLRHVKNLGDAAVCVLGNHDFHLLMLAYGFTKARTSDTLQAILATPDRAVLIDWLRHRPLIVHEDDYLMVHAGLLPQWTAQTAACLAREVETHLRDSEPQAFFAQLYGNEPNAWRDDLAPFDRMRLVVNACARLRFCTADGGMEFAEKRAAEYAPSGYLPWFSIPERRSAQVTIVCGHWSTLGLTLRPNLLMLDSGCVWGGTLSAVRLEDRRVFQVPARAPIHAKPE